MNKKKLVISLLVFILVLSLALTALVGCKPDADEEEPTDPVVIPDGYKEMNTTFSRALSDALYNSTQGQFVNNLEAKAQLDLTTKYGDSTSALSVKFGAKVVLDPASDTKSTFGFSITDTKANANIVTIWYQEGNKATTNASSDAGTGDIYVDLGNGADQKNFVINGLNIKSVMANNNASVSDEEAKKINTTVNDKVSGVFEVLDIVTSLGSMYQANDNSHILVSLSLAKIFEDAGDLLDGLKVIDTYTGQLGLALTSSDLKTLLPALTIDLKINMEDAGDDDFEDASYTGIDVNIGVAKKDLVIKRTDDTNFVRINIAEDCELGLGLDFAFGTGASNGMPRPLKSSDWSAYKRINAVNFTAEGELTMNKPLGASFQLGTETHTIQIPEGTYTIKIAADINPVKLIGMQFNANGTDAILSLVGDIVNNVIDKISIDIADKANPDDTTKQLKLSVEGGRAYFPNLALLGTLGAKLEGLGKNGVGIQSVLNLVKGFIPAETPKNPGSGDANASGNGSDDKSGNTDDGIDVEKLMATLAPIIKNLTIEVNDGKAMVELKNQSVAQNHKLLFNDDKTPIIDDATGEQKYEDFGDTTLDAKVEANANGLTINANIKNIVLNQNLYNKDAKTNLTAKIEVNSTGVTITATSENFKISETAELPIDLVLKLTKFELGGCN